MRPLDFASVSPSLSGVSFPIFPYSYSSRGFPDVWERLKLFRDSNPVYLVSLYDATYHLPWSSFSSEEPKIRFWDSGGFEAFAEDDNTGAYPLSNGSHPWSQSLYLEAAKKIPWNGKDILVNFDDCSREAEVSRQVGCALELFGMVKGQFYRDLLIHVPFSTDPALLVEQLAPHFGDFHILGLTEKDIAPTWVHGVKFLSRLRQSLNAKAGRYVPIHIFGCLDPKTVTRFAFAGADIFDGLTWQRFFIRNGKALYRHEAQYVIEPSLLNSPNNLVKWTLDHNISTLEELRTNLTYAFGTEDFQAFQQEKQDVDYALTQFPARRNP